MFKVCDALGHGCAALSKPSLLGGARLELAAGRPGLLLSPACFQRPTAYPRLCDRQLGVQKLILLAKCARLFRQALPFLPPSQLLSQLADLQTLSLQLVRQALCSSRLCMQPQCEIPILLFGCPVLAHQPLVLRCEGLHLAQSSTEWRESKEVARAQAFGRQTLLLDQLRVVLLALLTSLEVGSVCRQLDRPLVQVLLAQRQSSHERLVVSEPLCVPLRERSFDGTVCVNYCSLVSPRKFSLASLEPRTVRLRLGERLCNRRPLRLLRLERLLQGITLDIGASDLGQ
mmetsp:Transcript_36196/g.108312  ORF Transcript_36196/g.108312 Transcript_36196/m.108312 type:complete len:287 (+) Transcript_36196:443-1303(+)